ncbi:hypothetical protein pb186bvf_000463 [Paramecium bursaria]
MNRFLICVLIHAFAYPIIVHNGQFGNQDLFLSQEQLIEKLQSLGKPIEIFNIQTQFQVGDQFYGKLIKKLESQSQIKQLIRSKDTFVSPYIEYSSNKLISSLQVQSITVNFQNLRFISEALQKDKSSVIVIVFSKISSNVKLLADMASSETTDLQETLTTEVEADETTDNQLYNITSNQLTGYLVFLILFFALWISLNCISEVQTPERFPRANFYIGKEN